MVVLGTKKRVGDDNRDLSSGHRKNEDDQEEEAKEVVVVTHPDGGKEEVELHEDDAEGDDATNDVEDTSRKIPKS